MSKVDIKSLLEAGAHFGHKTSRWNPKMRRYIYTTRSGIHILDLEQTVDQIEEATKFVEKIAATGKDVLLVGTKRHIREDIERVARTAHVPYVTKRWLGGTLTNYSTISSRVKRFLDLSEQLKSGELNDRYTKREVLEFEEEHDKLKDSFGGIADMSELPGAVFVADVNEEKNAVREANKLGIPVIGIVDSNSNPDPVDYPIAANDDARKTVALIAEAIAEAVEKGRKKAPVKEEKSATKPKKTAGTVTKKTEAKTAKGDK